MTVRPQKTSWQSLLVRLLLIVMGAVLEAASVIIFMAPFKIAPGGVAGIGVILNHLIGTPIGLVILLGNIPIQILAYRLLGGWRVVASTVLYVVLFSTLVETLGAFLPPVGVSSDVLLNALFGGILGGIGGGLVYRAGGTLGGTSTLARILQTKLGTPLSTSFLYTDTLVIFIAGLAFGWEGALYAIIALFVGGAASDYVLEGPGVIRTATIITNYPEEVSSAVLADLGRGVTAWDGRGMYTNEPRTVLFITVARPQVNALRQLVHVTDPEAFVVIGQGHAAYGVGFRR